MKGEIAERFNLFALSLRFSNIEKRERIGVGEGGRKRESVCVYLHVCVCVCVGTVSGLVCLCVSVCLFVCGVSLQCDYNATDKQRLRSPQ